MKQDFEGRVALITGAGKGLGRAYALWLGARGAKIVVNNRAHAGKPSSAQAVVEEIRRAGGTAMADEHAVEDEAGGQAMVDAAMRAYGRIDIVVCNAGVTHYAEYDQLSAADFRRVMDINFWGSVYPIIAALPHMRDTNYGRIVLTASTAGLFGQPKSAYYAASKSAMIGFVRSIAIDIGDTRNIRINIISPAGFTDMARLHIDAKHEAFMSPDRVAPVVGWLASPTCDRSGLILRAGCGRVRRAMIMEGHPIEIPGEDIAACWPALDDMHDAVEASTSFESGKVLMPEVFAGT